jgi:hypothetical protein
MARRDNPRHNNPRGRTGNPQPGRRPESDGPGFGAIAAEAVLTYGRWIRQAPTPGAWPTACSRCTRPGRSRTCPQ